jgi:hypothetical protein
LNKKDGGLVPYINESYTAPVDDLDVIYDGVTIRSFTPKPHIQKSQYGYRSGPRSVKEQGAIRNFNNTDGSYSLANELSVIAALEKIERVTTQDPVPGQTPTWVNERIYSEYKMPATKLDLLHTWNPWEDQPPTSSRKCTGWANAVVNSDLVWNAPNRSSYEIEATSLMRNMRPSKPEFELARFVGELRDVKRLGANPLSNNSIFGGAFLNYEFGIIPTIRDIQTAAEAVVKSDGILRDFAKHATEIVHRSRTLTLDTDFYEGSTTLIGGHQTVVVNGVQIKADCAGKYSSGGVGLKVRTTLDRKRVLRAFADFEFYIGDPSGFLGRIDSYLDKAQKLLGSGASASTIWELTPWTWMSDWFFDIGGLLSYQQDVADNGLVARRSGFLIEDTYHSLGHFSSSDWHSWYPEMCIITSTQPAVSITKKQWRWPGSPYSMSVNWDLDNFQWAIIEALGLSRARKLPFLHNL